MNIDASLLNAAGDADTSTARKIWGVLALVSGPVSAFHGYRRNRSVGWAIGWFALGTLFPVITPTIAVAQGFGKRK